VGRGNSPEYAKFLKFGAFLNCPECTKFQKNGHIFTQGKQLPMNWIRAFVKIRQILKIWRITLAQFGTSNFISLISFAVLPRYISLTSQILFIGSQRN
jgi:hypothetical protein